MSKSKKTRKNALSGKMNRRLFLIDVENYCGKPILSEQDALVAKMSFFEHFSPRENDLIVVGTSHTNNFFNVGMAWHGVRQVLGIGHDGADMALIKAAKDYRLNTFEEVVVLSGDGIFAETVEELALEGVIVAVVSSADRLSRRLVDVAPRIRVVAQPALKAA
ncbi:hypothetical protein [uncultured Adlercreutzia sp.]|uniref:hypothetical protein n=1 Tax=uncultured Adlercreutzia sp. TaxID=875803 RepID=UPI0025FEEE74|nr:hypothetical protein [uncultured Adlercreutzia sp.]